jgi:beta-xylosidase
MAVECEPGYELGFSGGESRVFALIQSAASRWLPEFLGCPNLLLQKFPAPEFTVTTKVKFTPRAEGEEVGLIVTGLDYSYVSVKKKAAGLFIFQTVVKDAESGAKGKQSSAVELKGDAFYLRVKVTKDAVCSFSYSSDGRTFAPIGEAFNARKGKWIGAKVGIFAVGTSKVREMGYADFDWFRVE